MGEALKYSSEEEQKRHESTLRRMVGASARQAVGDVLGSPGPGFAPKTADRLITLLMQRAKKTGTVPQTQRIVRDHKAHLRDIKKGK